MATNALQIPLRFVEEAPIVNRTPWKHRHLSLQTDLPWAPQDLRKISLAADLTGVGLLTSLTMLSFLNLVALVDLVIAIAKRTPLVISSPNVAMVAATPVTDVMAAEVTANATAEAT